MSLHEDIVVPDGFRLVEKGLGPETERSRTVLRHWRGLSADDAYLLHRWVRGRGDGLEELHTDVPVGMVAELEGSGTPAWMERMCAQLHPLRIDACALVKGKWLVLEVKANAGYVALGQVLCYRWYAGRTNACLRDAGVGVVTDKVQECVAPVFHAYGVEVFEVGECLDGSGR